MELVLLAGMAGAAAISFAAFKRLWPKAPEASTASLLGQSRPLTTGQIARGVFWGMWLLFLSQIVLSAVALTLGMSFAIAVGRSLGG